MPDEPKPGTKMPWMNSFAEEAFSRIELWTKEKSVQFGISLSDMNWTKFRKDMTSSVVSMLQKHFDPANTLPALEAEVERLRKALEEIDQWAVDNLYSTIEIAEIQSIVRHALGASK